MLYVLLILHLIRINLNKERQMKYKNAADILPKELLREIQTYAEGEILYVPSSSPKTEWGGKNGSRTYYEERNRKIRERFLAGETEEELAESYGLACNTIHKIIYS